MQADQDRQTDTKIAILRTRPGAEAVTVPTIAKPVFLMNHLIQHPDATGSVAGRASRAKALLVDLRAITSTSDVINNVAIQKGTFHKLPIRRV